MSVRRLHPVQPDSFSFTAENLAWAKAQMEKYPPGKQASAVIPLLWRAQEQNDGWVSEPAIRYVAELIGLSFIRAYEVATFYTMFQLSPVGRKAHVQVCGTTPCMIRGAGDLIEVCKRRIAPDAHELSADGDFSWEEVECLGACVNAPMVEIFSDTYEDLTAESFDRILDEIAAGRTPKPGPQVDRQYSAPVGGPTTLTDPAIYERHEDHAAPAHEATVPPARAGRPETASEETAPALKGPAKETPKAKEAAAGSDDRDQPKALAEPRDGKPDDLTLISGINPNLEKELHKIGIFHFDQIAAWKKKERAWIDGYLYVDGAVERDEWAKQAKALARGGAEEYERVFGRKLRHGSQ